MSFIETDGRSPRFLTRAQKWAMTNESAPSSSKKWLSTDTRLTRRTPASTSAKVRSTLVVAGLLRFSINMDSAIVLAQSEPCAKCSSHGLIEEVGQAQLLAAGDGLLVHPFADCQVEYPHPERRENDRTAAIHGSASGHDLGKSARHEASVSRLLLREMGGGVGLHDVLDVVNHVLRSQEYLGCEIAKGNMQHERVMLEERGIGDVRRRCNGREEDQITGLHKLCHVGNNRDRAVPLEAARCVFEFLALDRRRVVEPYDFDLPSRVHQELVNVSGDEPGAHDSKRMCPARPPAQPVRGKDG